MKERENVQGCSAHQGRTSAAKSYCMRERSDVYAQEARAEPKGKKAESAAGVTQERQARAAARAPRDNRQEVGRAQRSPTA